MIDFLAQCKRKQISTVLCTVVEKCSIFNI